MQVIPVLFEIHERDGKHQVVLRPSIPEQAKNLHKNQEVKPGDWMLLVSRVRQVRYGGGFPRVAGGDIRQLTFDGEEWDPHLRMDDEDEVRFEVELYPDQAETFLLSGEGILKWK